MGLKTVILGSVLGGAVIASGIVWAGEDAVNGAIDLIKNQGTQLETFEENEAALVAKLRETTSTIQGLQTSIAAKNKEIADLIAAGGDNAEQVAALQAQVTKLTADLAAKTKELDDLNKKIADGNIDLESDANVIEAEILRLQDEIKAANADAERLQTEVNNAGDLPISDTAGVNSAIDAAQAAIDNIPVDDGGGDKGGGGEITYTDFKMYSGTPISLNSVLKLDKISYDGTNYILTLTNNTSSAITFTMNNQEKTVSGGGGLIELGSLESLNGTQLEITVNGATYKYNLING